MKVLAIETTDQAGSVALLDDRRVVAELRLSRQQRSAQSLAPAMRDLLESACWRPADVWLVAVAIGPGSFTGLRVGVTTAKTFAYAVGCDLVGVPTLEVVAAQAASSIAPVAERGASGRGLSPFSESAQKKGTVPLVAPEIVTVLDAGRQQVFASSFRLLAGGGLQCVEPTALVDDAAWLARLAESPHADRLIAGPALRKFSGRLPANANLAPADSWDPRASTVGQLALDRHAAGQRDDPWQLVPQYHRPSAAEEKRAQAQSVHGS